MHFMAIKEDISVAPSPRPYNDKARSMDYVALQAS